MVGRSVEGKRVLPLIAVMPCRSDAKYTRRGGIPTGYCEIIPLGHRCPMGGMRGHVISIKRLPEGLGNNVSWADGLFVHI